VPDDPDDEALLPLEIEESDDARFGKISGPLAADPAETDDRQEVAAIVKVAEAGYIPAGVRRRAAISETIFTANLSQRQLAALERDPGVISVELSKRLGQTD
jgi:hypothetical protein